MRRKKNQHANMAFVLPARYFLRGFYDSNRFSVFLPFLVGISAALSGLSAMVLPKIVLDALGQGRTAGKLFWSVGCVGVLFAGTSLAAMLLRNEVELAAQDFLYKELTARWERGMLRMDYGAFVSQRGKLLAEKARNAISSPNWGVVRFLPGLGAVFEAFFGLLVCFWIVGSLHPGILGFLLLLFAVQLWFSGHTQKGKQALKEERAAVDRRLNYLAFGMRGEKEGKEIRLYAFDVLLRHIAKETVRAKREVEGKVQKLEFYNMLFAAFLLLLRDGTAYVYLIGRFLHSGMTLGDFTLYFAAITGIGGGLTQLARAVSDFLEAARYAGDFFEFVQFSKETDLAGNVCSDMDEGEKMKQGQPFQKQENICSDIGEDVEMGHQASLQETGNACSAMVTGTIMKLPITEKGETVSFTFENVSFSYFVERDGKTQEIPVIKNLNLTIPAGESIAIVGGNGAGKSTFVKLLCGLLAPSGGRILVNGVDRRCYRREDYFRLFSAVFQKSAFLPVSIAENITLDGKPKKMRAEHKGKSPRTGEDVFACGQSRKEKNDAVWDCIRRAGLEEKVKSLPQGVDTCLVRQIAVEGTELSGGQAQKLLLARALYKDAPVLVLDEPTAALDPVAEHGIYQDYRRMTKGKTSVFISHRLASTRFCDRILLFLDGRILESGTHAELTALGGQYAEMFAVQSQYYREGEGRQDLEHGNRKGWCS